MFSQGWNWEKKYFIRIKLKKLNITEIKMSVFSKNKNKKIQFTWEYCCVWFKILIVKFISVLRGMGSTKARAKVKSEGEKDRSAFRKEAFFETWLISTFSRSPSIAISRSHTNANLPLMLFNISPLHARPPFSCSPIKLFCLRSNYIYNSYGLV